MDHLNVRLEKLILNLEQFKECACTSLSVDVFPHLFEHAWLRGLISSLPWHSALERELLVNSLNMQWTTAQSTE